MPELVQGLRRLAFDLKAAVVATTGISDAVEFRAHQIPVWSDIRGCESIGDHIPVVVTVYRDECYNKDSERRGIIDPPVLKNNFGHVGQSYLMFDSRTTKLFDLEVYRE